MSWPEHTFKNWNSFVKISSSLNYGPAGALTYLCRGQADAAWGLKSSLARELPTDCDETAAQEIEDQCRHEFKRQIHLHVPPAWMPKDNDLLEWSALMQHYGAPTRTTDWSASPYVAAYFAAADCWDKDGAIWMFHVHTLASKVESTSDPQAMGNYEPWNPSPRLIAQQGSMLWHKRILIDYETCIGDLLLPAHALGGDALLYKIIVPKQLKPEMMRHLRVMNITAASLFPGVGGLGSSIKELIRMNAVDPHSASA